MPRSSAPTPLTSRHPWSTRFAARQRRRRRGRERTMSTTPTPKLLYLWHPGTPDTFSGYGLALTPAHLVGLVMIDRPQRAAPAWLRKIKDTFGSYQLATMTQGGAR